MNTATEEQIERIQLEGWHYSEIAVRAAVDPATAFRWVQKGLRTMPWSAAAVLVGQADGVLELSERARAELYKRRARPAKRAIQSTKETQPREQFPFD